jgi:plastocyanin
MKKLYTLITTTALTLIGLSANAVTINVSITNFQFTPSDFTAEVGDVVKWTDNQGTHGIEWLSVPGGAVANNSSTMTAGSTFSYTITTAGRYDYDCLIHGSSMLGGFTVTSTGIAEPVVNLITTAYPNPFKDKFTLKYGKAVQSVKIYNVVGEQIKSIELSALEEKVDVDFEGVPAGIYFIRTYNDRTIVETKKIVKAK